MSDLSSIPLANVDPALAWKPWQPDEKTPWNLKWAGHLYRRAAFGAGWPELQEALKKGPEAALDSLLAGKPLIDPGYTTAQFNQIVDAPPKSQARYRSFEETNEIQARWLYAMVYTPHPLLERLTLFWHNHFATSIAKVGQPALMLKQNMLLRKHALGKFRPFLLEMSKDPAMLIWLDSNSNVKGTANENYARELMELFSLGVGNYTEKDIKEAARAFTGWHTAGQEFVFNNSQHDDDPKTVLEQTGNWDGGDIVRILLDRKDKAGAVAPRFLARKLYRHFISEREALPDSLIEPLAKRLFETDYNLADLMGVMLRSRLFFSSHAYRQRIKSPAEFVVGTLRALKDRDAGVGMQELASVMEGLGQTLFAPPNVKGWDGGRAWLNSATHLARHNAAWAFVGGESPELKDAVSPLPPIEKFAGKEPEKQLAFLLDLFLQGDVEKAAHEKLTEYLKTESKEEARGKRLRETAHLILLMPEYQLA